MAREIKINPPNFSIVTFRLPPEGESGCYVVFEPDPALALRIAERWTRKRFGQMAELGVKGGGSGAPFARQLVAAGKVIES